MFPILEKQRRRFQSQATLDVGFRKRALRSLQEALKEWTPQLCEALQADLGKSEDEALLTEIGMLQRSIRYSLRHVRAWSRTRWVHTPGALFPGFSRVRVEPYGCALIISPWNYPVLLALDPLVSAIAAGNTAVLKLSEFTPNTNKLLQQMIAARFSEDYVAVVQGGPEAARQLLHEPFDCIFFTGSPAIGREVMHAAAERLIPVTLELGGKSPCIVDATANVKLAARRIAFGKIINAGQTCVAPDYVLVAREKKDAFVQAFADEVKKMLGDAPLNNPDYARIISREHMARLGALMKDARVLCGGRGSTETMRVEPTLLGGVTQLSPIMREEIFGPLLPVMEIKDLDEAESIVRGLPKPLACYIFSSSLRNRRRLLRSLSFGGGCVNDTLLHLGVPGLPFGGVGPSGIGSYHGKAGFDAFSHRKSVLTNTTLFDIPFRYLPLTDLKRKLIRLISK